MMNYISITNHVQLNLNIFIRVMAPNFELYIRILTKYMVSQVW